MANSSDANRHVREYLAHYLSFTEAPGYAVLVDGPWGVGKSYLIRQTLLDLDPSRPSKEDVSEGTNQPGFVYISLFGLKSVAEIDMAVLTAMHPVLGKKSSKLVGVLGRTALRYFNVDPAIELTELFNKFEAPLYVFDDLERCELSVNAVFGYINEFVEHAGRKVIVVANELEFQSTDEYRRKREKIVGKTLEVQLALDEVVPHFISKLRTVEARDLCERHSDSIRAVFLQSGLSNLRVLQQSLWDFERLVASVSASERDNVDGFDTLLRLFFALSLELKAGRIFAGDLTDRTDKIFAGALLARDGKAPGQLYVADKRYADLSLYDPVLSDGVLVDLLVKGIVDPSKIQASINASSCFAKGNEPPWQTVWHMMERSDDAFEAALAKMEEQFASREFTVPGEILHVFGIRLWLADAKILSKDRLQIVEEGKVYVDDLYTSGRLEPLEVEVGAVDYSRYDGFGGLGIIESESPEYRVLLEYLENNRHRSKEDGFPSLAAHLLQEMQSDPRLYVRRLCWTSGGDTRYANVPLLAAIEPAQFAELVLSQPPVNQRIILSAFKSRYEGNALRGVLAEEANWLEKVSAELRSRTANARPVGKWRMQRFIAWYIDPALGTQKAN